MRLRHTFIACMLLLICLSIVGCVYETAHIVSESALETTNQYLETQIEVEKIRRERQIEDIRLTLEVQEAQRKVMALQVDALALSLEERKVRALEKVANSIVYVIHSQRDFHHADCVIVQRSKHKTPIPMKLKDVPSLYSPCGICGL